MKAYTPSKLRENIYRILDEVASKGEAIAIKRRGLLLKIVPPEKKSRLSLLKKRPVILSDPEEIVHMEWKGAWKPKAF